MTTSMKENGAIEAISVYGPAHSTGDREASVDEPLSRLRCAHEYGIDRPDVTGWKWPFYARSRRA